MGIKLKDYINIQDAIKSHTFTREDLRVFGLKNRAKPIEQLLEFSKYSNSKDANKIDKLEQKVIKIGSIISAILGLIVGFGLLNYSGDEPINILYFLLFTLFLPLIFGIATIVFALFNKSVTLPSVILSKIIEYFVAKDLKVDSKLLKWFNLRLGALFSLIFSIAILVAFLITISFEDIAFGWSSTIDISPESFYNFVKVVSLPWSHFLPDFVPTLSLVENSHIYRWANVKSVQNAKELGQWWKFLLMVIVVYSILFRALIYLFIEYKYKKILKETILGLNGARELLIAFNKPVIKKSATKSQAKVDTSKVEPNKTNSLECKKIVAYNFSKDEFLLILDSLGLKVEPIFCGGLNSIEQDLELIKSIDKCKAIAIKSWEAPTLEAIDFIKALCKGSSKLILVPIGLKENNYKATKEDLEIWLKSLKDINCNIEVYNAS